MHAHFILDISRPPEDIRFAKQCFAHARIKLTLLHSMKEALLAHADAIEADVIILDESFTKDYEKLQKHTGRMGAVFVADFVNGDPKVQHFSRGRSATVIEKKETFRETCVCIVGECARMLHEKSGSVQPWNPGATPTHQAPAPTPSILPTPQWLFSVFAHQRLDRTCSPRRTKQRRIRPRPEIAIVEERRSA